MKIEIEPLNIFHSLAHFCSIDDDLMTELIKYGYSEESINAKLKEVGSKFYKQFSTSIIKLIDSLKLNFPEKFSFQNWVNNRLIISFEYSIKEFPNGIGLCNIIPISLLDEGELKTIHQTERNNHQVKVAFTNRLFNTFECHLVIEDPIRPRFVTIFPGILAPAIPNENMPKEELKKAERFWSNHIFISKDLACP